ncbi:MAG TPA: aldehyde dehydrogenase family protein, partial [Candidatus Saccharimonadales bacterium]|nr:aldehyde dehydrogenase family protein [Candidatus Saccharimonadales bacterium]
MSFSASNLATLAALANGIIPADERDRGAAEVDAAARLSQRLESNPALPLYLKGLSAADELAQEKFNRQVGELNTTQMNELLARVQQQSPAFFKQLRMDVSALYLSDPAVWQRIGFPGPSAVSGGYPDFDQPQEFKITQLKEDPLMSTRVDPAVQAFLAKPAKMLIGGEWREATDWIESIDPARGQPLGKFPAGTDLEADLAVKAARRAFNGSWRKTTPYERSRLLQKAASLMEKYAEELAQLITLENGKPLWEAKREAAVAVSWTEYYAGWATKLMGESIPVSMPGQFLNYTVREPLGVVAGITPPNYPLTMPLYKAAPALATGNTIIIKPSEDTSLIAIRLGEIFLEAGFPEGVFNVVTGYGETAGAALANHPDVDKITFTGSTDVGRILVKASAGNLKRVSLELGGKSPNIVFADADLEAALKGVFMGIFFCQGEICSAGSRVFVEKPIYEEFVGRLAEMAKGILLGHGLDPETKMGPLVSREQQTRVLDYIRIGNEEKAHPMSGGKAPGGPLQAGFFVEPTVFANVDNKMRIAQEEIFGPVACVIPFQDFPEAMQKGNDTRFGLAAGVWTRDLRKAHQAAAALDAGTVWVNCYNAFDNASPWGGMKESGWGREKGSYGLDLFTQIK